MFRLSLNCIAVQYLGQIVYNVFVHADIITNILNMSVVTGNGTPKVWALFEIDMLEQNYEMWTVVAVITSTFVHVHVF